MYRIIDREEVRDMIANDEPLDGLYVLANGLSIGHATSLEFKPINTVPINVVLSAGSILLKRDIGGTF